MYILLAYLIWLLFQICCSNDHVICSMMTEIKFFKVLYELFLNDITTRTENWTELNQPKNHSGLVRLIPINVWVGSDSKVAGPIHHGSGSDLTIEPNRPMNTCSLSLNIGQCYCQVRTTKAMNYTESIIYNNSMNHFLWR